MHPVNKPEVMLPSAAQNVDADGKLTNEETRALIKQLIEALVAWANRLKGKRVIGSHRFFVFSVEIAKT